MWSAISKIFTKNSSNLRVDSAETPVNVMDRGERRNMDMEDTFVTRLAKQRAAVKWLLSKTFNNKVPENLREPFYRDHENQEHLKPQIIGGLANAEIYCLALGNIYSDPNYHNLNHTTILQSLKRKGVPGTEQLTETTLIQTNPLRMNSHMSVIEMIMLLYTREVASSDRIQAAVQRFSHERASASTTTDSPERGLLSWVSHACEALRKRVEQDTESALTNGGGGDRLKVPDVPQPRYLKDLCDGIGLAALISYYCPDEIHWTDIRISQMPSVQDSIHNLRLVQDFCARCLPASIFHLTPEDVTYMRESMKQNLVVFLADLFNVIEINPAKCVRYPGMDRDNNVSRSAPTHPPLRKTNSLQHGMSEMTDDSSRRSSEDSFVVHRGKNIPTLKSVGQDEPLLPARLKVSKEKHNNDSKADERGEMAAGRPSNWEDSRKSSFAGRRSRRNSVSDDSQLTIENFGGSQDNLNFIGRNPDKEVAVHTGRKTSVPSFPAPQENLPVRSTYQDARGSFQLGYDNGHDDEKQDNGTEKPKPTGGDDVQEDLVDGEVKKMSFAELAKQKPSKGQSGHEEERHVNGKSERKMTSFAALPAVATPWQQHQGQAREEARSPNGAMSAQFNDIKMMMEERRRCIENEKRRLEIALSQKRQIVGKTAFLQAVVKDLEEDCKWLDETQSYAEKRRTPDLENMDLEQYQRSMAQMNSSLQDIQSDMQRLAAQQNQVQQHYQPVPMMQPHQPHYQSMQIPPQAVSYVAQQSFQPQPYQSPQQAYAPPLQSSASAPHIPQSLYGHHQLSQQRFYLHDPPAPLAVPSSPPVQMTPPRRTWAQPPVAPSIDQYQQQQQPELRTWGSPHGGGFVLHEDRYDPRYQDQPRYQESTRYSESPRGSENRYQHNGDEHKLHHSNSFTLSQQHQHTPYGTSHSTPSASPQHRNVHRQISQLLEEGKRAPVSLQQIDARDREPPQRKSSVIHAAVPAPSADDMEPRNISFIGNSSEKLSDNLSRLNITSGTRTYRIPSPTRSRASLQRPSPSPPPPPPLARTVDEDDPANRKGFYVSFDDSQPKRPGPPLRSERMSPKKERSYVETPDETHKRREEHDRREKEKLLERQLEDERLRQEEEEDEKRRREQERERLLERKTVEPIVDLSDPVSDTNYEMERKKEKIMLKSLQRKQKQEEERMRKEAESQARREQEKLKEEEKARKKEEQAYRRQAILEQYKMKKAIEEAGREGKALDKFGLSSQKTASKMRQKGSVRPRPKTIHIDSGSVQLAEGLASKGKKGSTSNLTAYSSSTMKRDYFRGSQDSLVERSMSSGMLYKDSPDDSRGLSPCPSANQTLGRRSSYKTSRGSSTDRDSLAYRFGDTGSGLGRATPPRRAPSPGMSVRHLPSPSGPGSLPGLMSRGRRMFDDGSSDISSSSSMMDYNGPRLYKQPATKSNRSIMLNAVECCVFPGVVNREAKKRVLEEISRSESKHFLILLRDAGCQFRALYSYCPEREEITKMYGTGPKQVNDKMFDKFFKYNSGGKCFSQVHTKHLTVTIDAFTIHNSLWQGKKTNLPNKKDMALVI